ncbi:MAG: diguanylate cyclase [Desulfuromonadales bacterium]|nr:MAG: diguanylate cyclase [Desulfuromonadales bacterium]
MRILVVDDDESLRGILAMVLGDDGHLVTTAESGEEALELYLADPFPLVITDIRMGGMSGIELLQRLKETNPETEVIVITSYASVDTAVTALRLGAYDYLVKPFEELEFISNVVARAVEKIRLVHDNRRMLDNLVRNRSELEQMNRTLQDLAVRDGLTGLYNRRYFRETIAMEVNRCRRHKGSFSLAFLDVDHFKIFNDSQGHPEGDMVLKTLAELLTERLRKTDVIARYGGEEFVFLLPETHKANGVYCAETVCRLIAGHDFTGTNGQSLGQVTVSIGVAAYPDDGADAEDIVRRADEALYAAKTGGRNRVSAAPDGGA